MIDVQELSKYQRKVWRKLQKRYSLHVAEAIMQERLITDLHPSMLCDKDFDAWSRWEIERAMEKDD